MTDGFSLDLRQLREHAAATERIAGKADVADDASHQVADMDQAYGLLCRPIAWLLKGPQDNCAEAIAASAQALHQTSQNLGKAVETYEDAEKRIAAILKSILERLDAFEVPAIGGR